MISNFRVIVVGGGVAGLTASHALQRAGIDHVVLERCEEVDPPVGGSIAIYPHGIRILHQIGCLAEAKAACTPCERFITRGPNGRVWSDSPFFENVKQKYVTPSPLRSHSPLPRPVVAKQRERGEYN